MDPALRVVIEMNEVIWKVPLEFERIRNLYRKTRGEPARFFPENPTFPV